jgi:glycosyltransferase involved in cell wall biosynthesis
MKKAESLCIITPVFNEQDIIESSVNQTLQSALCFFKEIEYIIINDGSTDNSPTIINENFNSSVFKIVHKVNGGFGSAVTCGIENSTNEWIICVPADSPLDTSTAKIFYEAIDKADVIVSYRLQRKGYNYLMHLNSIVFHFLVSNFFNIQLKDYNWIHMYRKSIFEKITIESKGIFMLAEVLIKAKKNKFSFHEVPVEQLQRLTGIATASKPSAVIKTIIEMLKILFYS